MDLPEHARDVHTTNCDEAFQSLTLGSSEVLLEAELKERIKQSQESGVPLKIKAGFDPTAPDLHLGHTLVLNRMKLFQDLGHEVYFLIGDFTGMIGDPTGKNETRKALTSEEVKKNAQTYKEQVFKILDPKRTHIVFNSTWLQSLTSVELIKLAATHTVARMLERDDFHKRYKEGHPISIHEFLYPLLQGYDSVALKADVELGGQDQKFNLLVGRELQRSYGQKSQSLILSPLLEGTDGVHKMSKSLGNSIALNDSPKEMFGKIMRISDELMLRYYKLIAGLRYSEFVKLEQDLKSGSLHPKKAKVELAKQIVQKYHSQADANHAAEEFEKIFSKGEIPEDITTVEAKCETPILLLCVPALVSSNSKFRSLCEQGGVSLYSVEFVSGKSSGDGQKILDSKYTLKNPGVYVLKVGKRGFLKVVVKK